MMTDDIETRTVTTAQTYHATLAEDDLLLLLARQDKAIQADPALADDPALDPDYDDPTMALGALKTLGKRIMVDWSNRLYQLVCESGNDADRKKLIDAFGLGETALTGAVASVLLTIASPAIAAAAAALIVKHFLVPAGGIVCDVWKEAIEFEA